MAARKTTADVMTDQIDKLRKQQAKLNADYERKSNEMDVEREIRVSALQTQIDALNEAKAKLEQKP